MSSTADLTRAEFAVGGKVNFWDGSKFITAAVTGLNLNPIDKIVEYKIFYRGSSKGSGKRSRTSLTTTPYFLKESVHFNQDTTHKGK